MTVPRRLAASARAARRRLSSTIAGVGHSGHLSSAALRNRHDVPLAEAGLTAAQKYMFDLNGFLVIRGAFDADLVARANGAIDHHADTLHERTGQLRTSGLYGRESAQLAGDGTTGRFDMGGMLGWRAPHREPFRELLTHPAVAGALNELVGVGYRLDHSPLLIAQERGSEGHTLHGGAVTESGEPAWPLAYECRHGQMRNQLLTVCMQLSAAPEGAGGGFCAVRWHWSSDGSVMQPRCPAFSVHPPAGRSSIPRSSWSIEQTADRLAGRDFDNVDTGLDCPRGDVRPKLSSILFPISR